jgi:hypothetical protein
MIEAASAQEVLEHFEVEGFGHRAFKGDALLLQEGVIAHDAHADAAFAHGGIFGALHLGGGAVDVILEDVVEEAQHVFDEDFVGVPLVPCFQIERGEAADSGAVVAEVVLAGGERDFAAQVGCVDLEAQISVMLGHHAVYGVGEDKVRLAGGEAHFDDLLEEAARIDLGAGGAVLGRFELEFAAIADGLHEFVGDQHAVVEIEGLAVEIARGFADFEKFLDLGVVDIEIGSGRATAQRALADGEREAIHDADEGDDARGLAVEADRFTDAAHLAPIGADAAAARGEPDIFGPGGNDAVEAVFHGVEVAGDGQAATGAAVGQHRSGGHEPQLGDVIIEALGVGLIVGIGVGHAGEEVLVLFAGEQIAIIERVAAEIGEQRVAGVIGDDREAAGVDLFGIDRRWCGSECRHARR